MPYDLMSFYGSGARAMAQPEIARAEEQAAKLQQQYAPERASLEQQQLQADTQAKAMKLQSLVRDAAADESVRPELAKITQDPSFVTAPASDQLGRIAKIYMAKDPVKAADFLNKAAAAKDHEAKAEEHQWKAADEKLNEAYRLIDSIDPSDPDAVNKVSMQANMAGFNPSRFQAEARQYGVEKAIEMQKERLKPMKERIEEAKIRQKQAEEAKREERFYSRQAAAERHAERIEALRTGAEARKSSADLFKQEAEMHKLIKEARVDLKDDEEALRTMGNTDSWYEFTETKDKRTALKDRIAKNKEYIEQTQQTLRRMNMSLPKSPSTPQEKALVEFAPDEGYIPTKEHAEGMLKAMKAIEEGADKDAVIKKLRSYGIMVN